MYPQCVIVSARCRAWSLKYISGACILHSLHLLPVTACNSLHLLLAQITTVEIGPDILGEGSSEMQAWRQDMQLANVQVLPHDAQAEPPPRFLVINPGDVPLAATPNPATARARQETPGVELQPTPGWTATPTTSTTHGAASAAAPVGSAAASKM